MDLTPILLLLGVVFFWFVVFVFSLLFFKSSLRAPTEAELELAEEHKHAHDASTALDESVRPSVAH
jgi:ABC-type sugar transport system permease subunit